MRVISSSCCGRLIRRGFISVEWLLMTMICVGRCGLARRLDGIIVRYDGICTAAYHIHKTLIEVATYPSNHQQT